jgi:hypothetical protein
VSLGGRKHQRLTSLRFCFHPHTIIALRFCIGDNAALSFVADETIEIVPGR